MSTDIKVIGVDRMCFRVDPVTLEPRSSSCYDSYAYSDPEPGPTMSAAEWNLRLNEMRDAEMSRPIRAGAKPAKEE